MKRVFTLVVLLSAMTFAVQAQGIKFGVKGGLNITDMSFSEDVVNSENQTGFFVGPTLQVNLPLGLGVDIAALYDQRGMKLTDTAPVGTVSTDEEIKQKALNVPVNLRYKIGLGKAAGIYLAAGPQFSFPLSDKVFDTKVGEYRLKDSSLSVNLGAGLYLTKHLEVGFTYNMAAGKTGEFENWKDVDTKANAWQVNAAIFF